MKEKLKKKSFWLTAAGAAVLILQLLGVKIDAPYVNEIVSAACAALIFFGIMTDDTKKPDEKENTADNNADSIIQDEKTVIETKE